MSKKAKYVTVTLSLILLIIFAVTAGFGLALWDSEVTVSEWMALAFPKEEAEHKTLVISDDEAPEKKDDFDGNILSDILEAASPKDNNLPFNKSEDKQQTADAAEGSTGTADGSAGAEGSGSESVGSGDGSEGAGDGKGGSGDKKAENKEREPLKITSEISGIATVVRAGAEDDSVNNELPVPTQTTATATDLDPLKDYPLPLGEVDLSYFDDALFIGDSRVAGLAMNSGTNATFYAVTSFQLFKYKTFKVVQTPNGKVPIFDAMPYDKFTKIYIKVGLNELGTVTDEPFLDAYTSLINDLRVMQPRAIIYIQAILPVTQVKSQNDRTHCNENIAKRNENLKSFAELMKCYYVDAGPYFADETGALKAETTADGIHMYSKYMPQWIDALRHQAVVWPPQ